ncbi:MAG: hypothetical protein RBT34_00260 [Anaerolineaceae bacterium]|nr:hypothetical protein [Anaerolineaceae bacterium]
MKYTIQVDGQELSVPENIGESDELLTRALAPVYPAIANAQITRVVDKNDDQHTIVKIVKRAGTKGVVPLNLLAAHPGSMNPAIEFYINKPGLSMVGKSPDEIEYLHAEIEEICEAGDKQGDMLDASLGRLHSASPVPGDVVPVGF